MAGLTAQPSRKNNIFLRIDNFQSDVAGEKYQETWPLRTLLVSCRSLGALLTAVYDERAQK